MLEPTTTTSSDIILETLVIFFLILANGVLAMAELAVTSSRKSRLQQRIDDGDERARTALALAEDPTRFLSTVQAGISLISILTGVFGGATVAREMGGLLLRAHIPEPWAAPLGFLLVVAVITFLSLIFGELVPKRIALYNPEGIASVMAGPMVAFSRLASPLVTLLTATTHGVLRLLGIRAPEEPSVTGEEIKFMMEQAAEEGEIEEVEQDMVESVLGLGDRRVSFLMTPRTEIVWLDVDDPPEETRRRIVESGYSTYPVFQDNRDRVLGVVGVKALWARGGGISREDILAALTQPLFIPETATVLRLLEQFKVSGRHLALVTDEYGGIQGLVTLKDVMEAIVGDLPSVDDTDQPVVRREDGSLLLDGALPVDRLKEVLEVDELTDEEEVDYQTLAGFITTHLGRIPAVGEYFDWKGWRLEIVDMDGRRLDRVLASRQADARTDNDGTE